MKKISFEEKLTLFEHLQELRYRIIFSLVSLFIFSIFGYFLNEKILMFITKPLDKKLVYLTPVEAFLVRVKVSIFSGFFFSSPLIIYQATAFILPGLKKEERKIFFLILFSGIFLFLLGGGFAVFFLPLFLKILTVFSGEQLQPLFTAEKYIGFVFNIVFSFSLIFEFPVLIVLLTRLGIVSPETLRQRRKYIILGIFTLSAILTPGSDIFTQIIFALPLLFLFEISIYAGNIWMKNSRKMEKNGEN